MKRFTTMAGRILGTVWMLVCATTPDAVAQTLPKDPCALLKPGDIQVLDPDARIGSGVADTRGTPMIVGCEYKWGTDTREWGRTFLAVRVIDASTVFPRGLSADQIRQGVLAEVKTGGPDASELPGIGDGALFTTNVRTHDAAAKAYFMKSKGVILEVSFHGGDALAKKDRIIALLKSAATRL